MSVALRVVSWNLAYGKPAAYKAIENRRRQWALLGALRPDIILLQECRPDDLNKHAPSWMAETYEVVGALEPGWRLRASLLVRKPLRVSELDPKTLGIDEARWLEAMPGCFAAATVLVNDIEFAIASVHTLAQEANSPSLADADHDRLRRSSLERAWYNDVIVGAFAPWTAGRAFLVGGDWNNSPLFDTTYPPKAGSAGPSTEFFHRRRDSGWFDAMRKFHDSDVRTYLDERSAPYELDRVFTDRNTHDRIQRCYVLNDTALNELSDHAPIVLELQLD